MDNFIQNFKKRSRSREKDSHNYKIEQRNKVPRGMTESEESIIVLHLLHQVLHHRVLVC